MRRLAGATLLVVLTLAGTPAAAQGPDGQSLIFEGPGGRTRLTEWVLRKDPQNRGIGLGWSGGGFSGSTVSVPNVAQPEPYSGKAGAKNYEGSIAWYRTTFQAPAAGLYALSFQSANYLATVWVDGHELGSHRGSYLPFVMRRELTAGAHTVVVRVDWQNPGRQSREGFHRTWFNWGGLDGEVDVEPIGESELSAPQMQTTLSPDSAEATAATVELSVLVHNYGPERTLEPSGTLARGEQSIPLRFAPMTLAHGQSQTARATVTVSEPALWSPSNPALYELTLAVGQESSYEAMVGLRQITWHGGLVYLNGKRLQLHGVSIQEDALGHGDALTPADEDRIVSELEQVHADVVRSQHPLSAGMLERLDAAGILVWQGIGPVEGAGNWQSRTPQLLKAAEDQAREAVGTEQLHPSIFAWNLVDEVAGNGHDPTEVAYVQHTAKWIHAEDRGRLVAVDVWGDHPPHHAGPLYSDVDAVAETDYSGWYDSPDDTAAQLEAMIEGRLRRMQKTFAGKVLVISEFGAESNGLNPEGQPGSYAFQSRLLASHIRVYAADPHLSAMMLWLLRDYPLTPTFRGGSIHQVIPHLKLIEGLNQKGLFTYAGRAKPAAAVVARLYEALPAP